jgi:RNA 3'-terminal phosphate cyclase (ATP)
MALGGGGAFRTLSPTGHTRTHADLLRTFLGAEIRVREEEGGAWVVEVPGTG